MDPITMLILAIAALLTMNVVASAPLGGPARKALKRPTLAVGNQPRR